MEKVYTSIEKKETEETEVVVKGKIEIPKEHWEVLKTIAKRVGGDFGMEVKLGKPGEGSFFDCENNSIVFDPLHIKDNFKQARFVAGHEGSHWAITLGPKEMGLPLEKINELYSQIGFSYLQNVIEDPAVNGWMSERFPGMKLYVEEYYNEEFKKENAVLVTPVIHRIAIQLGYWPKFAQYGSEIIRDWYQNRFSATLDPAVKEALERTIEFARESISIIPDPQKSGQNKGEIITTSQKRFKNNTNYIWPEMKKLVEMDLYTEEQRQMLQGFRQKQKELEQKKREMKQIEKKGNQQEQEKLQREIDILERELSLFNYLPEEIKREIQEQIDKTVREVAEKLDREIEEKQKKIEEVKQKQKEIDEEIQDLEEKVKSATGKEKEKLEKQIQEKKSEKLKQEMKQKQAEQELKMILDVLENIQSGKQMPYPEDNLSQKTKQKLKELFNKLPDQKQKELRREAERQLEDFEDAINEEMQGKLNESKPEKHKKRRERENMKREMIEISEAEQMKRKKTEEELKRLRNELMTPYERARAEVAGLIDDFYYRLRKILKPEEYEGEEAGHFSGQRLDINRAMQAKKDVEQKYKLWIKETISEIKDYGFWHLIDLSGSMEGKKIEETFKGFIVAAEAIDRTEDLDSTVLTIRQGITGFHNKIFPFKNPNERFTKKIRDLMSTMIERTRDKDSGTSTYSATYFALENLKQYRRKTANFLLTFSDGEPNFDDRRPLEELLKKGKQEREGLKIKIGLIWIGEGEDEEKLQRLIKKYGYDFGLIMPAVKMEKKKTFSKALADLLENIIKNPENY